MKKRLKDIAFRLFVVLPMWVGAMLLAVTIVVPLLYWVITGRMFMDDVADFHESLVKKRKGNNDSQILL